MVIFRSLFNFPALLLLILSLFSSCKKDIVTPFICGTSIVNDASGNTYQTLEIGTQCWLKSNLKTTKYNNGDLIPSRLGLGTWQSSTSGAFEVYDLFTRNDSVFGKLYNQYAVTDSRGICPTGWHVPTDIEWNGMRDLLGDEYTSGGVLKSLSIHPNLGGWLSPNLGATDSAGFTALPGGKRNSDGSFDDLTKAGYWWTSSSSVNPDAPAAIYKSLRFDETSIRGGFQERNFGFSVRCIRGPQPTTPRVLTSDILNITSWSASSGGNVISDGGADVYAKGVCYSNNPNPTIHTSINVTYDGSGLGGFVSSITGLTNFTRYYVRAYAINTIGITYGDEKTFFTMPTPCPGAPIVSDVSGNVYETVQIGNQCWMKSNLRVNKYRNGDTITTGLAVSNWLSTTQGAFVVYDDFSSNALVFGKLYNHYAVTDNRGLCPTGWRVPSDSDYLSLINNFGGLNIAGGALKDTVNLPNIGGWQNPNVGATNNSGFSALPGGLRDINGNFSGISLFSYWWTSTLLTGRYSVSYKLFSGNSQIYREVGTSTNGYSVRCLRE
jgi:uncharacterized protein (TIGR02145 family)